MVPTPHLLMCIVLCLGSLVLAHMRLISQEVASSRAAANFTYNVLSAVQAGRILHFHTSLAAEIVVLTGRSWLKDSSYEIFTQGDHIVNIVGYEKWLLPLLVGDNFAPFVEAEERDELKNRIGNHNLAERRSAAFDEFMKLVRDYYFMVPGTVYAVAGPSFLSNDGKTNSPDLMYCPAELRQNITSAMTLKRLGRDLQIIRSKVHRDHIPVIYFAHYLLDNEVRNGFCVPDGKRYACFPGRHERLNVEKLKTFFTEVEATDAPT